MRVPKNVFLLVLAVTIHNIPEGFVQGPIFPSLRQFSSFVVCFLNSGN
jgi:zinc transporter ZupT